MITIDDADYDSGLLMITAYNGLWWMMMTDDDW